MKNKVKSVLGVTLLEIMLVLAIAAMIIVMSVRYYQSATTSQQSTQAMNLASTIGTAMDSLSAASGGAYTAVGDATTATPNVTNYLGGANALNTPTGGVASITGAPTATTYAVKIPLSVATCNNVKTQLNGNPKINNTAACAANGDLTYTYDKTK